MGIAFPRQRGWALAMLLAAALALRPGPAVALDSEEQVAFDSINAYRAQYGLPALVLSPTLTAAAAAYSRSMADNNFFSHIGLDGSTLRSRVQAAGYLYNTWLGENLAAGRSLGLEAFHQWQLSPPHNANMLSARWQSIGIARAYNPASRYHWYWVMVLGGIAEAREDRQMAWQDQPAT